MATSFANKYMFRNAATVEGLTWDLACTSLPKDRAAHAAENMNLVSALQLGA